MVWGVFFKNIVTKAGEQAKFEVYNIVGQAVDVISTGRGSKRSINISGQPVGQDILMLAHGEQKRFRVTLAP